MSNENFQEEQTELDDFAFLDDGAGAEEPTEEGKESPAPTQELSVNMRFNPIKQIFDEVKIKADLTLPIPMSTISEMGENHQGKISGTEAERTLWATVLEDFVNSDFAAEQGIFTEERMARGDWHQGLVVGDTFRRLAQLVTPALNEKTTGLDSDEAIYLLDDAEDNHSVVNVRCFSIGVVFRMRTRTLLKLSHVYNRIARDKRVIGVDTAGAGYSNESTYLDENLMSLLESAIIDANIEKFKTSMLKEIVDDAALDEMLLGLASLQYQKGYEFSRPCIAHPDRCSHVDQGIIDILDCIWIDNSILSEKQLAHWNKTGKHKLADIKEYRNEFAYIGEEETIAPRVKVTYQSPLLKDKISAGTKWLNSIHRSITEAFIGEPSASERVLFLREQFNLAIVGAYVPYIKKIEVTNRDLDGTRVIEDQEAIRDALISRVGTNDELIKAIIKGVLNFQANNRITVFGVPKYTCPKCGTPQGEHGGAYGTIIPYSPRVTFMNLGVRKVKARNSR